MPINPLIIFTILSNLITWDDEEYDLGSTNKTKHKQIMEWVISLFTVSILEKFTQFNHVDEPCCLGESNVSNTMIW